MPAVRGVALQRLEDSSANAMLKTSRNKSLLFLLVLLIFRKNISLLCLFYLAKKRKNKLLGRSFCHLMVQFQQFLQNSSHNYFYYFIFLYNLKNIKSNYSPILWKVQRPSHRPTVLFPIYQIMIGPSDGGTIVQATQRSSVLY